MSDHDRRDNEIKRIQEENDRLERIPNDFALKLADNIAEQDPTMVRIMRKDWNASMGVPVNDARKIHHDHLMEAGFGDSRAAGIAANREKVLARSKEQRGA